MLLSMMVSPVVVIVGLQGSLVELIGLSWMSGNYGDGDGNGGSVRSEHVEYDWGWVKAPDNWAGV